MCDWKLKRCLMQFYGRISTRRCCKLRLYTYPFYSVKSNAALNSQLNSWVYTWILFAFLTFLVFQTKVLTIPKKLFTNHCLFLLSSSSRYLPANGSYRDRALLDICLEYGKNLFEPFFGFLSCIWTSCWYGFPNLSQLHECMALFPWYLIVQPSQRVMLGFNQLPWLSPQIWIKTQNFLIQVPNELQSAKVYAVLYKMIENSWPTGAICVTEPQLLLFSWCTFDFNEHQKTRLVYLEMSGFVCM